MCARVCVCPFLFPFFFCAHMRTVILCGSASDRIPAFLTERSASSAFLIFFSTVSVDACAHTNLGAIVAASLREAGGEREGGRQRRDQGCSGQHRGSTDRRADSKPVSINRHEREGRVAGAHNSSLSPLNNKRREERVKKLTPTHPHSHTPNEPPQETNVRPRKMSKGCESHGAVKDWRKKRNSRWRCAEFVCSLMNSSWRCLSRDEGCCTSVLAALGGTVVFFSSPPSRGKRGKVRICVCHHWRPTTIQAAE